MPIALDAQSQADLWIHMFKKCLIRLGTHDEYQRRASILEQLQSEVEAGSYSPKPILGFLSAPKGRGVVRFIPIFSVPDLAIYFGCVKAFDEELAGLAIQDTFGGWSLGGKRRELEQARADELIDPGASTPPSSYNKWAWLENWQQFWKLLAAKFEHAPPGACFVQFDVANCYDSVDLPRLERELRKHCPNETIAIEVLFFLLSTWNRKINQYARTTKGLPMDLVGDCSRVLANFYLVPFDTAMREIASRHGSSYLRYADDMVLLAANTETCQALLFAASNELHRLGLNINVSKVQYLSKEQFDHWWGFEIMDKLEMEDSVEEGMEILATRWTDEAFGRRSMAMKRAISKLSKLPELEEWRAWTYEAAVNSADFSLLDLNESQMQSLVSIAHEPLDGVDTLATRVMGSPYTQPKACLLRCMERLRDDANAGVREYSQAVIAAIGSLNEPVLNLAIQNMPAAAAPRPPEAEC